MTDSHTPLASYSKGMRQKILLSAALLHDPEILILDEPFSGLDVTSALMLRSLMRKLADRGKIILYSSHVLEVVEKVCSNVLILRNGEVAAYDSIVRLRELMSQPSLEGVFAQLAEVEDGEKVANRVVNAMAIREEPGVAGPVALGVRVYRGIAGAMPEEFNNAYGEELLATAEEAVEPAGGARAPGGWRACCWMWPSGFQSSTSASSPGIFDLPFGLWEDRRGSRWSRFFRSAWASAWSPVPTRR
jgi:ABC-type glutathione transport system ATPase component